MPKTRPLLLAASLALVAACSTPGASPSSAPSGTPGASPSPSAEPTAEGLEYPTGADEVVLRLEEGGGFVPAEFAASNVPWFTLYGDGTVIFRKADEVFPAPPDGGGPTVFPPLRVAKLAPDQIQALLQFAVTEGGLAVAKPEYRNDMIADAGTTTFTINAGGVSKTVAAYALGLDAEPNADSAVKAALVKLAERLRDFDQQGTLASEEYVPSAFEGLIWESGGGAGPAMQWPWQGIAPDDFVADQDPEGGMSFPKRVMTAEEISALGLTDVKGAVTGIQLTGPDSKVYSFVLRPLLPDQAS